jgi:CheY-like chemotaxis protein
VPSASARILVIDDEPGARAMARAALQGAGYEVAESAFGAGAVDRVRQFQPDLVLLDLVLPDASGVDLLKGIRATKEGASIPVVGFTGYYATPEEAMRAAPGFTGYVLKPVKPAKLVQDVAELLRSLKRAPRYGE